MKCPLCQYPDTKVVDSRVVNEGLSIRRRRECLKCEFRFSTYEEMEILDLTVVKRDGTKEVYNREKIIRGLRRALEKRPMTEIDFRKLLNLVELDIQTLKKSEVSTDVIGEVVMNRLQEFDQVAYIRFASVYRCFEDVASFEQEIRKLLKQK
ncbi:transcriptional repressor NrdR [Candidatus Falkowbacteria bacterium]|uniref:Transcriptional repressor NrdR n=1 Tax=Candidatus Falkowbacteria bacterium CG10_big_fil_rev_8_21_14_0_10_37_14 TaxID=1974561 RepID=A0A2M6WTT5_9BACT|nr:transcriptional repressor NrdR [Candidatus Falkowbacteria bacterium]PIT96208.1 MAG: transcriptional regulator NrdR [Candidatus Falkowbacteria bacterium CG10_big_fil_rev_8_21_14_0_10_37_14]